jgi:hypothetical protein
MECPPLQIYLPIWLLGKNWHISSEYRSLILSTVEASEFLSSFQLYVLYLVYVCYDVPCHGLPCKDLPCHCSIPCQDLPCNGFPCHDRLCMGMPHLVLPCIAVAYLAMSCLVKPYFGVPCLLMPFDIPTLSCHASTCHPCLLCNVLL